MVYIRQIDAVDDEEESKESKIKLRGKSLLT